MENRADIQTQTENYEAKIAKQDAQIAELTAKLEWYEEQFRLAQYKRASSEKTHPDQMELNLFNEAEVLATPASEEPTMETVTYSRKKPASREAKLEQFRWRPSTTSCRKKSGRVRAAAAVCMR